MRQKAKYVVSSAQTRALSQHGGCAGSAPEPGCVDQSVASRQGHRDPGHHRIARAGRADGPYLGRVHDERVVIPGNEQRTLAAE